MVAGVSASSSQPLALFGPLESPELSGKAHSCVFIP